MFLIPENRALAKINRENKTKQQFISNKSCEIVELMANNYLNNDIYKFLLSFVVVGKQKEYDAKSNKDLSKLNFSFLLPDEYFTPKVMSILRRNAKAYYTLLNKKKDYAIKHFVKEEATLVSKAICEVENRQKIKTQAREKIAETTRKI